MTHRLPAVAVVVLACGGLSGCGSGGSPGSGRGGPGPATAETVDLGTLQVGVASAAGFQVVHFAAGGDQPVAFTGMYGSRIVKLDAMGFGRLMTSSIPDGTDYEIMSVLTDGFGRDRYTSNGDDDNNPTWSPDGTRIAFDRLVAGTDLDVVVKDLRTGVETNLTNHPADDYDPAWSPDGERIAFVSDRSGDARIHVVDADGTNVRYLEGLHRRTQPAWSPDGRHIALVDGVGVNSEVYSMDVDIPKHQNNLTRSPSIQDDQPCWSPDGRQIAFGRDHQIWLMDAIGANQAPLTHAHLNAYEPAWSPDGNWIAFSDGGVYSQIYMIRPNGLDMTEIPIVDDNRSPTWCPVPQVVRTLIGPSGSDYGAMPSLGAEKAMVVVAMTEDGVVSAVSVGTGQKYWPILAVEVLRDTGSGLAGLEVTGTRLHTVQEDMGRARPTRVWDLPAAPATGAVTILFSGRTGKVTTVLAVADTAFTGAAAEVAAYEVGQGIRLAGEFVAAYDARDPARNHVDGVAQAVTIDQDTGEIVAVE